jgi:post-segregation antitoxin (ccd killing protein)
VRPAAAEREREEAVRLRPLAANMYGSAHGARAATATVEASKGYFWPRRRCPANLSLPHGLLEAARPLGVNASQTAEAATPRRCAVPREEEWLKANEASVDEHAAWLDRHGMPLEPAWPE